jgi:hypothetical protein
MLIVLTTIALSPTQLTKNIFIADELFAAALFIRTLDKSDFNKVLEQ